MIENDIDRIIKCKDQWDRINYKMITTELKLKMIIILDSLISIINNSNYFCDKEEIKFCQCNDELKTTDYTDDKKMNLIFSKVLYLLNDCISDERLINMNREIKLKEILNER